MLKDYEIEYAEELKRLGLPKPATIQSYLPYIARMSFEEQKAFYTTHYDLEGLLVAEKRFLRAMREEFIRDNPERAEAIIAVLDPEDITIEMTLEDYSHDKYDPHRFVSTGAYHLENHRRMMDQAKESGVAFGLSPTYDDGKIDYVAVEAGMPMKMIKLMKVNRDEKGAVIGDQSVEKRAEQSKNKPKFM